MVPSVQNRQAVRMGGLEIGPQDVRGQKLGYPAVIRQFLTAGGRAAAGRFPEVDPVLSHGQDLIGEAVVAAGEEGAPGGDHLDGPHQPAPLLPGGCVIHVHAAGTLLQGHILFRQTRQGQGKAQDGALIRQGRCGGCRGHGGEQQKKDHPNAYKPFHHHALLSLIRGPVPGHARGIYPSYCRGFAGARGALRRKGQKPGKS